MILLLNFLLPDVCLKLDGNPMIKVQSCAIRTVGENEGTAAKPADTNQKIIANSQLVLQLDLESLFPGTVVADSIKVTMSHSEFNTRLPESPPPPPPPLPSAGGRPPHQRKTSVVHRSSSTRSTASAMSSSSSSRRERQVSESSGSLQFSSLAPEGGSGGHEGGDDDADEEDVVWPRLKLQDVRDGKASESCFRQSLTNQAIVWHRRKKRYNALYIEYIRRCE